MARSSKFNPVEMRKHFHSLTAEGKSLREKSAPLRDQVDKINQKIAKLEEERAPLMEKIKKMEEPLFEIDNERAMMVRALGGKTGNPDGTMPEPKVEAQPS